MKWEKKKAGNLTQFQNVLKNEWQEQTLLVIFTSVKYLFLRWFIGWEQFQLPAFNIYLIFMGQVFLGDSPQSELLFEFNG